MCFTINSKIIKQDNKAVFKEMHVPIKVIVAGAGIMINEGKKLFQNANKPKAITVIPNATHCFDEDGVEENLFQETYKWYRELS